MAEEKANRSLVRELLRWYRAYHRRLPWRETKDPYRIWVSEVMLQQTTVRAVVPHYARWLRIFPDVEALARASLHEVLKAWQGLGYYQRARNLRLAARIICQRYDGAIPAEYEALIGLPGVGPYIAAAVLSLAYDKPFPVLDANVRRVGMRLYAIHGKASSRSDNILLEKIRGHFPAKYAHDYNQAMMELGALVCRPLNPSCLVCPVQRFCLAYESGEQEVIPTPRKRAFQKIEAVVGIISDGRRYLIQKRPAKGLLAGLWEFPGGKKKKGESLRAALHREIKEELGVEVRNERLLFKVRHAYTHFQVNLFAFECELESAPRIRSPVQRWVSLPALKRYPVPSGSARIVGLLEDRRSRRDEDGATGS